MHPLETLVRQFLSSDQQLMPETIKQIHLLEIWLSMVSAGLLLLILFFKYWQQLSPQKIKGNIYFLILICAVLMRIVSAERGFETMEWVDGVHYAVSADEFVKSGDLILPLNQENHPGSKAPGFALLIAPFYLIFKNNLGAGVFCPLLLGIFSLLILYQLAKNLFGEQTALIALLFLSFSPLHITYSRLMMPSMAPLFFILAATFLLTLREKGGTGILWIVGFLFGFAATIRYLAAAAIPAAMIYLLLQNEENYQNRLKKISILVLGAIIPLGILFYYQWQEFGSPWLTGYSYWTYFYENTQKPFAWEYGFGIPPSSGGSTNVLFNLISATGAYIPFPNILGGRLDQIALAVFVWTFVFMGLASLFKINRSFFAFCLTFFLGYYIPHAFLFAQGAHFMLPVIPFIILLAAFGLQLLFRKLSTQIQTMVCALTFIGLVSFIPIAYSFSHTPFQPTRREFIDWLKTNLPNGSFLISDFEPILFTHELGRDKKITFIAISQKVPYADRKLFMKGKILSPPLLAATESSQRLHQLLKENYRVYLSIFKEGEYARDTQEISHEFALDLVTQLENFRLYQVVER